MSPTNPPVKTQQEVFDAMSKKTRTGSTPDEANEGKDPGFLREFWMFLRQEKQWWLIPLVLGIVCISVLSFVALSPVAPFIYTLF